MSNIILIGMPASGKSTVGVVLAKILGMDFVDTDLLIQSRSGERLEKIIERVGVDGFLDFERDVCLAMEAENTVVATGGSVVYREETMLRFKRLGTVVYLKVSLDELGRRLSDMKARGVALKNGQTLAELYGERTVLYEKYADVTIDEKGLTLEQTARRLSSALAK
ncbi:MAG: shikimate kinase [Clostridia bacterium]|nr:shikimate kinase [Clostridia bacterium]